MSSFHSHSNSNHSEPLDNLCDLEQLPFFTTSYFNFDSILSQSAQITPITIDSAFSQISIPSDFCHHKHSSTLSQSQSHIQYLSQSFSSIPDLVPNKDLIYTEPDLFPVHNTFDLISLESHSKTSSNTFATPPPACTPSDENPPDYQPP